MEYPSQNKNQTTKGKKTMEIKLNQIMDDVLVTVNGHDYMVIKNAFVADLSLTKIAYYVNETYEHGDVTCDQYIPVSCPKKYFLKA